MKAIDNNLRLQNPYNLDDQAYAVAVDSAGNVVVTGISKSYHSGYDNISCSTACTI